MGAVTWADLKGDVLAAGEKIGTDAARFMDECDPNGKLRPATTRDGTLRLFGHTEGEVRVVLYRDPAYWCPYCQRITLQLEHKRIPYRIRMINMRCYGAKPEYYLRKVPSGLLPAIELDGRLITESRDIMLALERAFPDHESLLWPVRDGGEAAGRELSRLLSLERECFALWCGWLFRPSGDRGRRAFEAGLAEWSRQLDAAGPFLLGPTPCLADILAVPFFERYAATTLYWKGYQLREQWPAIDRWMSALGEQVQAFDATMADDYSTVHDIPPQYGTAFAERGSEPFQRCIDGWGDSWSAPAGSPADRLEAASALARGGAKLVQFALRAVGDRPRTVSAALADPDARPGRGEAGVERAMLALGQMLLGSDPALGWADDMDEEERVRTVRCLCYFRDRIGVPRDMSRGAAQALRVQINGLNERLLGAEAWRRVRDELAVPRAA